MRMKMCKKYLFQIQAIYIYIHVYIASKHMYEKKYMIIIYYDIYIYIVFLRTYTPEV